MLPAAAFDEDNVGWLLSVLKERVAGAADVEGAQADAGGGPSAEEKGEHELLSGHCRVLFAIGASRVVEGGRVGLPRPEAEAERLKLRLRLGNDDDDAPSERFTSAALTASAAPFKSGSASAFSPCCGPTTSRTMRSRRASGAARASIPSSSSLRSE